MKDASGIDFCELCGLGLVEGICPNCNPVRKLSKAGEAARLRLDRQARRAAWLTTLPGWQRPAVRLFWWLTA